MNRLLKDKLISYNLILASVSPRRRELLGGLDLDFTVAPAFSVEEVYDPSMPAGEVAEYLSSLKSDGYPAELGEGDILITADTVVVLDGRILGKPSCPQEARDTLAFLSGRTHTVITGMTLRSKGRKHSFSVESKVTFGPLTAEQIEYYVDRYKPFDKAGSYGIQEWIGFVAIERIEGSFYNVMGLPVQRLYTELERFVG